MDKRKKMKGSAIAFFVTGTLCIFLVLSSRKSKNVAPKETNKVETDSLNYYMKENAFLKTYIEFLEEDNQRLGSALAEKETSN